MTRRLRGVILFIYAVPADSGMRVCDWTGVRPWLAQVCVIGAQQPHRFTANGVGVADCAQVRFCSWCFFSVAVVGSLGWWARVASHLGGLCIAPSSPSDSRFPASTFSISWNDASGSLPESLSSLLSLTYVHSRFGCVPALCVECVTARYRVERAVDRSWPCPVCRSLDVSRNMLNGTVPSALSALTQLR